MLRTLTALGMLTALAATVTAQPGRLPLSPGVMPASPYGPGMPPAAPIPQQAGQGNTVFFPVALPWGWGMGWGYQTYNPWTGYGYSYGGLLPAFPAAPAPVTVEPPRRSDPVVVLAQEFPATLTLQFPAAAEVWLDGKKMTGEATAERALTSPVLTQTQQYTFAVRARWTTGGKTYEAKRSVALGAGDRSRLYIVSGDEVKE